MSRLNHILYRLPEESEIWKVPILGVDEIDFKALDLSKNHGFVFAPFDKNKNVLLYTIGEPIQIKPDSVKEKLFPEESFKEISGKEYKSLVESAVKEIKGTALDKVVMASKMEIKTAIDSESLFYKLCNSYPHAFVYLIPDELDDWVGASPEMFIRYKNGKGKTVALAGTQDKQNKNWGNKEKEEQKFIQSYIEDKMDSVDGLVFKKGDTRTIRAGNIEHISSLYEFESGLKGVTDLLKIMHPTPAVGGSPDGLAIQFIQNNENLDRSYYSGVIGLNTVNTTDLFVNLRCAKISKKSTTLYAGAGITIDSDSQNEWIEICKKLNTLLEM